MARAGSIITAAVAVLLIGQAAEAKASDAAGASLSSAAATAVASPALEPMPRPWGIAEKPRYAPGGWRCSAGLVWRNAGSTDWLCVDPAEAQRIEQENEAVPDATDCPPGQVRREAFRNDPACVDPERREAIRRMNAALYTVR